MIRGSVCLWLMDGSRRAAEKTQGLFPCAVSFGGPFDFGFFEVGDELWVVVPVFEEVPADDAGGFVVAGVMDAHEFPGPADFLCHVEEGVSFFRYDLAKDKRLGEGPQGMTAGEGG